MEKDTESRLRNALEYTRKPDGFDDVSSIATPAELKSILDGEHLPVFRASELWDAGNVHPMHDWDRAPPGNPLVFGLIVDDTRIYLVNTEGYTYCRYVTRLMDPATPATFAEIANA